MYPYLTPYVGAEPGSLRFGGLSFHYSGWSIQGYVELQPDAEIDPEDPELYVSLAASPHTPVTIFASMSGAVHFLAESDERVNIVRVFTSVESLIESAAMHHEVTSWVQVDYGTTGADRIEERAARIGLIPGPSGEHESWYGTETVRVHVHRPFRALSHGSSRAMWAVWAKVPSLAAESRRLLKP